MPAACHEVPLVSRLRSMSSTSSTPSLARCQATPSPMTPLPTMTIRAPLSFIGDVVVLLAASLTTSRTQEHHIGGHAGCHGKGSDCRIHSGEASFTDSGRLAVLTEYIEEALERARYELIDDPDTP